MGDIYKISVEQLSELWTREYMADETEDASFSPACQRLNIKHENPTSRVTMIQ